MTLLVQRDDYREDPDFGFVVSLALKTRGVTATYAERLVDGFMRQTKAKKMPDYMRYQGLFPTPFGPLFVVWNCSSMTRSEQIFSIHTLYQSWFDYVYDVHPFLNPQACIAYGDLLPTRSPPFTMPSAKSETWRRATELGHRVLEKHCAYETRPLLADMPASQLLFHSPPLRYVTDQEVFGREESMQLRLYLVNESPEQKQAPFPRMHRFP